MKTAIRLLLFATFAVLVSVGDRTVRADEVSVEITFGYFYDRLSPHGHWHSHADHGWCWSPRGMEADWRPYTRGNWRYANDCGWYWHSDYEWSWAGHHYGRWVTVESSWRWVPGYEWSGAWVVWRHGGGHVGWAPLPPRAHWEVGVGIRTVGFSYETDIHEHSWAFVADAHFTSASLHTVIVKPSEVGVIIRHAPVSGSVSVSGGVTVNHAITLDSAVKFTGKPIKAHSLRASATLGGAQVAGGDAEIRVFRPRVKKGDATPPRDSDNERVSGAARKTMKERHEAEGSDLKERQEKSGKDESRRKAERDDLEKRHKQDDDDFDRRNGKSGEENRDRPDNDSGKVGEREPGKEPRKDSGKQPDKESGKEPHKESGKEPSKEPGKEPGREPGKEPGKSSGKEPGKEPAKEPGKEPVKEPVRDPGKSSGKEPGKEPAKEPKKPGKKPRE